MSEIKMTNGNATITFYVFSNGNAICISNGKLHTITDFAETYIALRESGYEG